MPTVAVIGLGRMGGAMARRFHGAGYELILWNRDRAKTEAIAAETESKVADTAAEAASQADVVLSSLADDEALRAVYLGDQGVVGGIGGDTIAVDTSTVSPNSVRQVGEAVEATGAGFVDSPVSGSVSTVEAGGLIMMAGGDPATIATVEPVLSALAKQVVHVGGRGAGAACKLAVNGLVHGLSIALAEALVLAEKAGVQREAAYEVFANGAGGAPYVHYKRGAYEHPEEAVVAFTIELMAKDLELITALASEVGAPMEQARLGLDLVRRAIEYGLMSRDMSAVAVYLREQGA